MSSVFAVQMKSTRDRSNEEVEVVVAEARVLLRVEHLEHRGGRVAAEVGSHLVDLVDQEDGIARLGVAEGPDDGAGHRADVGAPVAADLRLVSDTADRDPRECAPEGAGDRMPEQHLFNFLRVFVALRLGILTSTFSFGNCRYSTIRSFTFSRS